MHLEAHSEPEDEVGFGRLVPGPAPTRRKGRNVTAREVVCETCFRFFLPR